MQVGLALDQLQSNTAFSDACYGSAILTVVPVVFEVVIAIFVFLVLDNILSTAINWAKHNKQPRCKGKQQTSESSRSV
jgi:hypothetical protein